MGQMHESPGTKDGIPGLFYFSRSELFPTPPKSGEFVKWFAFNVRRYQLLKCNDIEELGDFSAIEVDNDRAGFFRFFNNVVIDEANNTVTKTVVDHEFDDVHQNEIMWYREAKNLGFRRIPEIYSETPLIMERVNGLHASNASDFTEREKRAVLADYLDTLFALHDLGTQPTSVDDLRSVYIGKTRSRVEGISALIPMFDRDAVTVNGKKCKNIFADKHQGVFELLYNSLIVDYFVPIHGLVIKFDR